MSNGHVHSIPQSQANPLTSNDNNGGGSGSGGGSVEERLARIEERMNHLATKADVEAVKTEMATMKSELLKWCVTTIIACAVAMTTVLGALATIS